MGRMLPVDCEHGVTIDWGDFGPCQGLCEENHPEDLDDCPDYERCEQCEEAKYEPGGFYPMVISVVLGVFGFDVPERIPRDVVQRVMDRVAEERAR